jgi:hypothetical protein
MLSFRLLQNSGASKSRKSQNNLLTDSSCCFQSFSLVFFTPIAGTTNQDLVAQNFLQITNLFSWACNLLQVSVHNPAKNYFLLNYLLKFFKKSKFTNIKKNATINRA